jgi:hypothetical protein
MARKEEEIDGINPNLYTTVRRDQPPQVAREGVEKRVI